MNCNEIFSALENNVGRYARYLGCFPLEALSYLHKEIRDKPSVFIINILSSNQIEMGHWVCVYVSTERIIFLDSFAIDPGVYSSLFNTFINSFSTRAIYVFNRQIQNEKTLVCGVYCVYFVHLLSNFPILKASSKILNSFTSDTLENDKYIMQYAYTSLNMPGCNTTFCPDESSWCSEQMCDGELLLKSRK